MSDRKIYPTKALSDFIRKDMVRLKQTINQGGDFVYSQSRKISLQMAAEDFKRHYNQIFSDMVLAKTVMEERTGKKLYCHEAHAHIMDDIDCSIHHGMATITCHFMEVK